MTYIDGIILPLRDDQASPNIRPMRREIRAQGRRNKARLVRSRRSADGLEHGKVTDFYKAVAAEDGENVVFSFVLWPDKATRDKGWETMMADPEMQPDAMPMPFDGKRMFWGGFKPFVNSIELGA